MTGRKLPKPIWIIKIKGARKEHLAASDEFGEPYKRTLCGKVYEERTYGKKVKDLSGHECVACREKLDVRLMPLRSDIRKLILR